MTTPSDKETIKLTNKDGKVIAIRIDQIIVRILKEKYTDAEKFIQETHDNVVNDYPGLSQRTYGDKVRRIAAAAAFDDVDF